MTNETKYYCQVHDGTIVKSMVLLPEHLTNLDPAQLAMQGWYAYEQHLPAHDPLIEKLGHSVFTIHDYLVTETWVIQKLTNQEHTEAKELIRAKNVTSRNSKLKDTDWLVIRHRDQADAGSPTTLSASEYISLLLYRQQLRDLPEVHGASQDIWIWPSTPAFITHSDD